MRPQSKAAPVLPDHLFRALLPILLFTAAETLIGQGRPQRTNMKAIKTPLLVLLLILVTACDSRAQTADSLFDVFPLKPGLLYGYLFDSRHYSADELTSSSSSDSGLVEYLVSDSATIADTVFWTVRETRLLLRKEHGCCMPAFDTAYWIIDTTVLSLAEINHGKHELRCKSLIWYFPVPHTPSNPIYRYADSSVFMFSYIGPSGYSTGWDTLSFSTSSGYFRRGYSYSGSSGYTFFSGRLGVQLVHNPLLSVAVPYSGPRSIFLRQNYPNPFNPSTTIRYGLPSRSHVTLTVFNTLGQQVATLVEGEQEAGYHEEVFNASGLASGVYLYRLTAGSFVEVRKLLLIR